SLLCRQYGTHPSFFSLALLADGTQHPEWDPQPSGGPSPTHSNPVPICIKMLGADVSSRVPQRVKGRSNGSLVVFECSVLLDDDLRQLKYSTIKRRRRIYVPVHMLCEVCPANSLETEHHGYSCRHIQVAKCFQVAR